MKAVNLGTFEKETAYIIRDLIVKKRIKGYKDTMRIQFVGLGKGKRYDGHSLLVKDSKRVAIYLYER